MRQSNGRNGPDLKQEVERKWQTFVRSSRRDWVEYDDQRDTRSKVDFKEGTIQIETIIPDGDPKAMEVAQSKIMAQARKILETKAGLNEPVLKSQVRDPKGAVVTAVSAPEFVKTEIVLNIKRDPLPYDSADGKKRRRYFVGIKMVPEHLNIRAKRYLPLVEKNAKRFNLDPRLLMALIHTESYFNPLAVSGSGAVGLMQIIPRYGGRDAYRHLYDQDWAVRPEYLYAPGINVELGSAYMHLLQNRYFSDIRDPEKNRYVSICVYNWGPTAVRTKILKNHQINQMSDGAVFSLLKEKTPNETSDYLSKVTNRMALYSGYFR